MPNPSTSAVRTRYTKTPLIDAMAVNIRPLAGLKNRLKA